MGLMARVQRRVSAWRWRLRYWWLDTREGEESRLALFIVSVLVAWIFLLPAAIGLLLQFGEFAEASDAPGAEIQRAIYPWVIQLIIAVALMAVSYALRPKIPAPQAQEFKAPVMEDGTAVKDVFGTVWIDDPFWLAHRMVGKDKIKTKGSKK